MPEFFYYKIKSRAFTTEKIYVAAGEAVAVHPSGLEISVHPLLPALQLLALGRRKDMASPLLLERSLLGRSGGIWLVRRLPVFTCHDVLPKVRVRQMSLLIQTVIKKIQSQKVLP